MPEAKRLPEKYQIWTTEMFVQLTKLRRRTVQRRIQQAIARGIVPPMERPRAWNYDDAQRLYEFLQHIC